MTGIVDAHLHLWELGEGRYGWLGSGKGPLCRSFRAEEAAIELAAAGVSSAVLVQADDTDDDTDRMLAVAADNAWVAGVVGWVDLADPRATEARLDEIAADPVLCGIRHLVHADPDPWFLDRPEVATSLALLARRRLAFDVPDAWPRHLDQATSIARGIPELTVVLDHLGKPPRGGDLTGWRRALERFAAVPNTVAKVSGLHVEGTECSPAALTEIWLVALEAFGPERLMWGGDWPMTVPHGGYAPTFDVLGELIRTLSATEQQRVLGDTARQVYRLAR
ncbi:amidohydrolase [Herbiconiux sp. P15]|uniref:amidohydrolase family protein n=1 Tax=Herbiconiux liukaitaii TaxID=3342799 RepID=UPI0035B961CD